MPLLFRTMRRPMHRHRPTGRGGGVTPRNLITPTHRLAPAGSEPFSHGETETKTRVDNISGGPCSSAFVGIIDSPEGLLLGPDSIDYRLCAVPQANAGSPATRRCDMTRRWREGTSH